MNIDAKVRSGRSLLGRYAVLMVPIYIVVIVGLLAAIIARALEVAT